MKKTMIAILVLLLSSVCFFAASAQETLPDSTAWDTCTLCTQENPHIILTKAEFNALRTHSQTHIGHFKLGADLLFTEEDFAEGGEFYANSSAGSGWIPFGNRTGTSGGIWFKGNLDGDNHVVSGIRIFNNVYTRNRSLFGNWQTGGDGYIRNLVLSDFDIATTVNLDHMDYSAVLASCVNGSATIENITVNNCSVYGGKNNGLLISRTYTGSVALNNIEINDSTLRGRGSGAVCGILSSSLTANDITVRNTSVNAGLGGCIVGIINNTSPDYIMTINNLSVISPIIAVKTTYFGDNLPEEMTITGFYLAGTPQQLAGLVFARTIAGSVEGEQHTIDPETGEEIVAAISSDTPAEELFSLKAVQVPNSSIRYDGKTEEGLYRMLITVEEPYVFDVILFNGERLPAQTTFIVPPLTQNSELSVELHLHEYIDWETTTAPTCIHEGIETGYCLDTDCDSTMDRPIPPTGEHVFSYYTVVFDPTCVDEGVQSCICSTEGCVVQSDLPIPILDEHSYETWVTVIAPTCTVGGLEKSACSVAGCTDEMEQYIPPTGVHVYTSWTTSVEPLCWRDGAQHAFCDQCGAARTDNVLQATGAHVWGEWIVVTEATFDTDGERVRHCSDANCTASEQEVLPKTKPANIVEWLVLLFTNLEQFFAMLKNLFENLH